MLFNNTDKLTINEVKLWMDGGTVTLVLQHQNSSAFEVEFVQKVALKRYPNLPRPGSLQLNGKEVEVRSDLEKDILIAIQRAGWSMRIKEEEKVSLKKIIEDCINFINSDTYLELAKNL